MSEVQNVSSRSPFVRLPRRPRLLCLIRGHAMEHCDLGHGTGVTIYHCTRCPYWWAVT